MGEIPGKMIVSYEDSQAGVCVCVCVCVCVYMCGLYGMFIQLTSQGSFSLESGGACVPFSLHLSPSLSLELPCVP